MNLEGKTALVTGGAVRIGRAICEALAARGCRIVIHFNHSSADANELAASLKGQGREAFTVRGDLSTEAACVKVIAGCFKKAGRLDILVNNAAVFHKTSLMSSTGATFSSELDVNFIAPVMLTREFARRVLASRPGAVGVQGKVINLLDRRIAGNGVDCLPYLLSKKMLAEFTRSSALALAPFITVNGVAPGAILPPPDGGGRGAHGAGRMAEGVARVRDLAGRIPMERRCTPGDIADTVSFLLQSDGITGQTIFVDGGQHLLGGSV